MLVATTLLTLTTRAYSGMNAFSILTVSHLTIRPRVEDVDSQDLGLGDKINFGVFGEQHLSTSLLFIWKAKANLEPNRAPPASAILASH